MRSAAEPRTGGRTNWLGYQLLKDGTVDKALLVFKRLVQEYPSSADAWDSLGDGYEQQGHVRAAADAYRQAMLLDPSAEGTRRKLNELQ